MQYTKTIFLNKTQIIPYVIPENSPNSKNKISLGQGWEYSQSFRIYCKHIRETSLTERIITSFPSHFVKTQKQWKKTFFGLEDSVRWGKRWQRDGTIGGEQVKMSGSWRSERLFSCIYEKQEYQGGILTPLPRVNYFVRLPSKLDFQYY